MQILMMRFWLILIILLFFLPLFSTESYSPKTTIKLQPDTFEEQREFTAEIAFVGTAPNEEILSSNSVYDIISEFVITPIYLKVDISGYTHHNLGNVSIPPFGELNFGQTTTVGQLYFVVDGEIEIFPFQHLDSLSISLTQGDHSVSILYVSRNEEGQYTFAYDSITIRIRSEESFDDYSEKQIPLEYSVFDNHDDLGIIEVEAIIVRGFGGDYGRRFRFNATLDLNIQLNGNDTSNYQNILMPFDSENNLRISGSYNSSGFAGLQILGNWSKVQGISFFVDAAGIHQNIPELVTIREGNNFVGVVLLRPYGMWHQGIPEPIDRPVAPGAPNGEADWDWSVLAPTLGDDIVIDSSFDFAHESSGLTFFAKFREVITTEVTEDDVTWAMPLFGIGIIVLLLLRKIIKIRGKSI